MINVSVINTQERPFLAKLYQALFFHKVGLGNLDVARRHMTEAIKLSPQLVEQLEEVISDWALKQTFGPPLTLAQTVLDNLPDDLAQASQLRQRVLGKIHIAQAFDNYHLGHNAEARRHVFNGMRYDKSILKNRGVLSIFARSLLNHRVVISKPTLVPQEFDNDIPGTIAKAIETTIDATISRAERITITKRTIYLIEAGQKEYILHILPDGGEMVMRKLAIANAVRTVAVPAPAPLATSLSFPIADHNSHWLLEEKIPGSVFDPQIISHMEQVSILAELGRHLRRLHQIKVTGFGPISSAEFAAPYPTFSAWLSSKQTVIATACLEGKIPETVLPILDEAYRFLEESYSGSAVLCHCEITDGNIFITKNHINGLIDWNSVTGTDPAYDVAIFFTTMSRHWYPQQDQSMLAAFLEAYQPDEPDNFYRRVIAHRLLYCAEAMTWMGQNDELYQLLPSIMSATSQDHFQLSVGALSA